MFINVYLLENCAMNYSPSLCYSPEKRYMFAKFLILLIHWRKHGKVNSKFFEFSYAKLKSRNPRTTTINMTMSSVSYFVRYNKTLIDWIYPGNNKFIVPATPTFAPGLAFVNSLCLGVQYTCYYPHTIYY